MKSQLFIFIALVFTGLQVCGQKITSKSSVINSSVQNIAFNKLFEIGEYEIGNLTNRPQYHLFAKHTKNRVSQIEDLTCFYGMHKRLSAIKDTHLIVNTYKPDPLSINNLLYGGMYQDFDDSATSYLNSALERDSLLVYFDSGSFKLHNQFAKRVDFSSPFSTPITIPDINAQVLRNNSNFEAFNALYHITHVGNTLAAEGLDFAIDSSLIYDDNAMNGADESAFFPGNHGLAFGRGGVDDAEDADIIVHEYFHSIHHKLSPFTNMGTERRATEEGTCDYFAWRFSMEYTQNQTVLLFNWDGHNTFWGGRRADVTGQYPQYLNGNIYHDGQLWCSALTRISNEIGTSKLDSLLIYSISQYSSNQSMRRAAQYLLSTDSSLFAGSNNQAIRNVLVDYGFIAPIIVSNKSVRQQECFSIDVNSGLVKLRSEESGLVSIYTLKGQLITSLISRGSTNIKMNIYKLPVVIALRNKDFRLLCSKVITQ